ncbi:ubiquinone biosynthesis UbiH/UbiF/VisC/COQ6 family hydroxylase [Nitrobacteraceae bacterium AZCC 1564]
MSPARLASLTVGKYLVLNQSSWEIQRSITQLIDVICASTYNLDTDVVIIGAGPTGLSMAHVLAQAGIRVALLERQSREALANVVFDGRDIALTHESRRLMTAWGLWDHIPSEEISDLRHARVFDGSSVHSMDVRAEFGGKSQLGWMVSNHLIRQAAYANIVGNDAIRLLDEVKVEHVATDDRGCTVRLADGRIMSGKLLIAADSRFSETRRALGIPARMKDYGKSMMVFRVQLDVPHDHIAWEWFGYGQTRALLPLNGNQASVVLTLPHSQMQRLQTLDNDALDREIERRFEHRLGAMKRCSVTTVYPLVGVYSASFHARRFALIGDAAVGMHPVTAHGFNLGLVSVKLLSERLIAAHRAGQNFAAPSLLESHTRAHRRVSLPLYAATNLVVSLYTNDHGPARVLRGAALRAANAFAPFKRMIASQITG